MKNCWNDLFQKYFGRMKLYYVMLVEWLKDDLYFEIVCCMKTE